MKEDTDILMVVLYSVFSLLVLLSNIIVIIVIIRSRGLHLPALWNIAVMAAWDLALGLHFLVFIVPSKSLNAFAYPDSYGRASSILLIFIASQNVLNILLALVDRYISICWPLHYLRLLSARRFALAVIIMFLINLSRMFILLPTDTVGNYNRELGFYTDVNPTLFQPIPGGLILITGIIIISLMIRVRVELGRKRPNGIRREQGLEATQFTYTMYLSTLLYIVCYIPVVLTFLVKMVTKKEMVVMMKVGIVCPLSNSLWNVFIYTSTYRPFRDACLKQFCPSYFRERARQEFQSSLQGNTIQASTVM